MHYLWDDVYSTIELVCARCGSFVIDVFTLYNITQTLLDDSVYEEFESDSIFCGIVARVMRVIDDNLAVAWDALYDDGNKEPTEVAVILNPDCCCYSLFVGEDPAEQVSDEPDYSLDRSITVVKWIGPHQHKQYIPSFKNDKEKWVLDPKKQRLEFLGSGRPYKIQ